MAEKDPAVLLYIANWLTSTAGMDADCRGWYLNLLLHNYDKKGLPNDVETLAQLASVKFSEFQRFKHVLEHVLMQKFTLNTETGLLENEKTVKTLQSREDFKDKRQRSGNIGVVIKMANAIVGFNKKYITKLKEDLYSMTDEEIEEAKSEQVLKQMLKLYINTNKDINTNSNKDLSLIKERAKLSFEETGCIFLSHEFKNEWLELLGTSKWIKKEQSAINKCLKQLMAFEEPFAFVLVERAIAGSYQGVTYDNTASNYEKYLKQKNGTGSKSTDAKAESRETLRELANAILAS